MSTSAATVPAWLAPGVRETFRALPAERTPGGDSKRWLNDLIASGRYIEDVYAAG
ncbi:hypothetical protein [Streptomyces sp. R41]|uniref:Uncharacterized protein n=1 Tax=Streptomyces sp. R41 TaxID=3238632 RepID=A0AB39RUX9_9ACTN